MFHHLKYRDENFILHTFNYSLHSEDFTLHYELTGVRKNVGFFNMII